MSSTRTIFSLVLLYCSINSIILDLCLLPKIISASILSLFNIDACHHLFANLSFSPAEQCLHRSDLVPYWCRLLQNRQNQGRNQGSNRSNNDQRIYCSFKQFAEATLIPFTLQFFLKIIYCRKISFAMSSKVFFHGKQRDYNDYKVYQDYQQDMRLHRNSRRWRTEIRPFLLQTEGVTEYIRLLKPVSNVLICLCTIHGCIPAT